MTPMPLRRAALLPLLVMVLGAASCSKGPTGGDGAVRIPARNAATAALLPTDASALPEIDLATFRRLLDQLRGTPVVVNVWGSWCGPCRTEAPSLAAAARTYADRVQFLGIDILDSRDSARAFMRRYGWRYPSLFDPTAAVRDGLGLLGQPDTIFYGADGHEVSRWTGPIPADELMKRVEALVAAS